MVLVCQIEESDSIERFCLRLLTVADKKRIAMLKKVRRLLTIPQGHITLKTDGEKFHVLLPAREFDLED